MALFRYTDSINTHSMPTWSPESDSLIEQKYSLKSLEQKVSNKTALRKELGWPIEGKRPMVALPLGMSDELGGKVLKFLLPGLPTQSLELVVLGKGSKEYGALLSNLIS